MQKLGEKVEYCVAISSELKDSILEKEFLRLRTYAESTRLRN